MKPIIFAVLFIGAVQSFNSSKSCTEYACTDFIRHGFHNPYRSTWTLSDNLFSFCEYVVSNGYDEDFSVQQTFNLLMTDIETVYAYLFFTYGTSKFNRYRSYKLVAAVCDCLECLEVDETKVFELHELGIKWTNIQNQLPHFTDNLRDALLLALISNDTTQLNVIDSDPDEPIKTMSTRRENICTACSVFSELVGGLRNVSNLHTKLVLHQIYRTCNFVLNHAYDFEVPNEYAWMKNFEEMRKLQRKQLPTDFIDFNSFINTTVKTPESEALGTQTPLIETPSTITNPNYIGGGDDIAVSIVDHTLRDASAGVLVALGIKGVKIAKTAYTAIQAIDSVTDVEEFLRKSKTIKPEKRERAKLNGTSVIDETLMQTMIDTNMETNIEQTEYDDSVDFCIQDDIVEEDLNHHRQNRTRRTPTSVRKKKLCKILINEFSTENPGKDTKEFIELTHVCLPGGRQRRDQPYDGYSLLIIKGITSEIITLIDLPKITFTKRGSGYFYVIGSTEIPFADKTLNHIAIQRTSVDPNEDVIPGGSAYPHAIVLVHLTPLRLKMLNLPPYDGGNVRGVMEHIRSPLKITKRIQDIIKEGLLDLIVYGKWPVADSCNIFEELWPAYKTRTTPYVLLDWEENNAEISDTSLSRCATNTLAMNPESFKYTTPTPGETNACDLGVSFVLSRNVGMLSGFSADQIITDVPCAAVHASSGEYSRVSVEDFNQEIRRKRQKVTRECRPSPTVKQDEGRKDVKLVQLKAIAAEYGETGVYPWEDVSQFTNEVEFFLLTKLPVCIPSDLFESTATKSAIEVIPDNQNPEKTRLRCRFCRHFFEDENRIDRPASLYRTTITTEHGFEVGPNSANSRKSNIGRVRRHLSSQVHLDALDYMKEQLGLKLKKKITDAVLEQHSSLDRYYVPTENFFEWIISFTRLNIPAIRWKRILDLGEKGGVPLGHLYRDRREMTDMVDFVSQRHRKKWLKTLVESKQPLSVVLDASVDRTGQHVLLMYIQTLANGVQKMLNYKLEPMGGDLSGKGYWDSFMRAVNLDGDTVKTFFKHNIVAVASDGASCMTSVISGFVGHMIDFVGRRIPNVWCLSHRVNLVAKTAVHAEDLNFLKQNVKLINELHSYLGTPLRFEGLKKMGDRMGLVIVKLPRIIEVRWIPSERRAFENVIHMYPAIIMELFQLTRKGNTWSKQKAKYLHDKLVDASFVAITAFAQDVNDVLAGCITRLQRQNLLLIDMLTIKKEMVMSIEGLRMFDRKYVQQMIDKSRCVDWESSSCIYSDFFNVSDIIYKRITLDAGTVDVTHIKTEFIDRILARLEFYFPGEALKNLEIFLPQNIPVPDYNTVGGITEDYADKLYNYGQAEIIGVCEFLGFDDHKEIELTKRDWGKLIESIVMNPSFRDDIEKTPGNFWIYALSSNLYEWTERTQQLISSILVIPATSVQAEVGFSQLQWIQDKLRNRMRYRTINNIYNLLFNLPDDPQQWGLRDIVIDWLKSGHSRVDDLSRAPVKTRHQKPELQDEYEEDELWEPIEEEVEFDYEVQMEIVDDND